MKEPREYKYRVVRFDKINGTIVAEINEDFKEDVRKD